MPIIGFTGKIGSGKTTASVYIQEKYGFQKLSFVDKILIPELQRRKMAINRQNLQKLGRELYLKHGDIKLTEWLIEGIDPSGKWIIDDIRYPTTAKYLREKFLGHFWIIGVKANVMVRYQRVLVRGEEGNISYQDFLKMDSALTEQQIEKVLSQADYCIENNQDLSGFYQQCDKIMRKILG